MQQPLRETTMKKFDPARANKTPGAADWASWADVLKCPAEHACSEDHHLLGVYTEDGRFGGLALALTLKSGEIVKFDLPLPMVAEMVEHLGRYHLGILPGGQVVDLD